MDDHSGTQNTVLVIKTGTFHHNAIRRNQDQLVTGPCQIPCVFKMMGFKDISKYLAETHVLLARRLGGRGHWRVGLVQDMRKSSYIIGQATLVLD